MLTVTSYVPADRATYVSTTPRTESGGFGTVFEADAPQQTESLTDMVRGEIRSLRSVLEAAVNGDEADWVVKTIFGSGNPEMAAYALMTEGPDHLRSMMADVLADGDVEREEVVKALVDRASEALTDALNDYLGKDDSVAAFRDMVKDRRKALLPLIDQINKLRKASTALKQMSVDHARQARIAEGKVGAGKADEAEVMLHKGMSDMLADQARELDMRIEALRDRLEDDAQQKAKARRGVPATPAMQAL